MVECNRIVYLLCVLPLAMAAGMSPCPAWMKEELAKFVVENFSEEERKALCDRINQSEEVN